jgi:hypothetical protein
MSVDEDAQSKVTCPLCGEYVEPSDHVVGVVWAVMWCEQCKVRHDGRAKTLLAFAGLLEEDTAG